MIRRFVSTVSLAALTLFASLPAQAETMKHEAAGFQFDLPEGWTSAPEGDNKIRVKNADESVEMVFIASDKDSIEAAAGDVATEVDDYLTDVKFDDGTGKGKEIELNGIKAWELSGTGKGKEESDEWAWSLDIFLAKKPVVVLFWATPEVIKNPPADLVALIGSIKAD